MSVLYSELCACVCLLSSYVSTAWVSQWNLPGNWQQGVKVHYKQNEFIVKLNGIELWNNMNLKNV